LRGPALIDENAFRTGHLDVPDPNRTKILNAFTPSADIRDPARFAGRRDLIETLADALSTAGVCPMVFGDRGLGKTSLANQIERIALGDVELLSQLGLEDLAIPEDVRFATFSVRCTDDVRSKDQLLQTLINAGESFSAPVTTSKAVETTRTHKLKLRAYEYEAATKYAKTSVGTTFAQLSIEEKLDSIVGHVAEELDRPVLLIIDELDRVRDTSGLASFIKSYASERLRFMLVGVGSTASQLLSDHESLGRTVLPVEISGMGPAELIEIVERAERYLADQALPFMFSPEAKVRLARSANGFPWFVHVIGLDALLTAYKARKTLVDDEAIIRALERLAFNRFAHQFRELYERAVGDSTSREIVLRAFARWPDPNIPTSDIYQIAHSLGVSNPSQHARELVTEARGAVVAKALHVDRMYAFRNPMFKVFIRLRPSIFDGLDDRCDEAWDKHYAPVAPPAVSVTT
jgi:hypothetical protein